FVRQLAAAGAIIRSAVFPDHHGFTRADAERLAATLRGAMLPVCTLKDAVKLAPVWPRASSPLWYVSQHVVVELGAEAIDALLHALMSARGVLEAAGGPPASRHQP
ncbi:MAG: tetraacyldisaccharide 4'-kinase, partial [Gemmatimonadota bacterium]|nr:tetraacyldisaccharide 4'-kinase [Gemmatimonadota bacterium]